MQNKFQNIAILLPCHNEEKAITDVIKGFQSVLPQAIIYVYDNCSTDKTAEVAKKVGAITRFEPRKGKGNVVKRMFADIDADVYLLVDGDQTYEAAAAPRLIEKLLNENLDMVVGTRVDCHVNADTYRRGHRFGNALFTKTVAFLFGKQFSDILSGYRVFSRRFVKSFPALSEGFDIETELTIHSLELRLPVGEVETAYYERPEGSQSKLNKYRDGCRILYRVISMLKSVRPMLFFGIIGLVFALVACGISIPLLITYLHLGLVPRLPTAILSTGLMLLACLSFVSGIILSEVCRSRRESKYLNYLLMTQLYALDDSHGCDCHPTI